ncbi:MAG: bifunctional 5,10-methylene-tetrahydrofolate dehydrogenase/5,10-methylene-tetrahydrofolate cyclohydrolase [Muribaculaceae bacterium]|nr:bifunctional 5,10-methylene-tetrahydrofolate dehydrogenase/5,10-methylene-tetrahydrofolate cyclohydrolase [Muribaculaceae bacterium]MDE6573785.1 bifunctional 5,10-methylene-tetrahydrofolate dehydrogenase/5,10-methylene-tetrahydrofolate cyclohydrolase [Muribaculaceae bacterium]
MTTIIDGKATSAAIKAEIAEKVAEMTAAGMRAPHLAAILVGHDGGSETYVANKIKACAECGFKSSLIRLESTPEAPLAQETLLEEVRKLNNDPEVDGFIVQLPLPRHIDEQAVIEAIDPEKDVDGFHPVNVGKQSVGLPCFHSATPAGIVELLSRYGISPAGKKVVIVGRSNIVGKPLAAMLMQKGTKGDATVTVCHSATPDLASITRSADILVAALGRPGFITEDMVAPGAVVIDVGTTRVPDATRKSGFRLSGDVDYENVAPKCSAITPVPGGVGPMTIVSLMLNTLEAARRKS